MLAAFARLTLLVWALTASHGPWGANALGHVKASIKSHERLQPSALHEVHDGHLKELAVGVRQNPDASVSHESWFSRLGDAFWSVVVGLVVVIPFSISLLWVNEKRNAQLESVISLGRSEVKTVEANQKDPSDHDGTLVHMNSVAKGLEPVADSRFAQVKKVSGILRLSSSVQVYQWEETEHTKKEKDSVGGGETTRKSYSYSKAWSDKVVDSSHFHQRHGHENTVHVKNLPAGTEEQVNGNVKYGEHHHLPRDLVVQLNAWENATELVKGSLQFEKNTFQLATDGYYYCPKNDGAPAIGDFRVKLEYVPDGPASILALQAEDKHHEGYKSFVPYRSVRQSFCCGDSDDVLKERRLDAARKTGDELYQENKCWDCGPLLCLCGCCNAITYFFTHSSATIPQVYSAWSGALGVETCFDRVKTMGMAMKWGLRLLGWVLLWAGFNMLFAPLEVIADIIPFLGPYLGSGISAILTFITFLYTMAIATFIVSCAYLIYHPKIGVLYIGLTGVIIAGIVWLQSKQ